jgi:hypothetical protein
MGDVDTEAYAALMQPLNHELGWFGQASCAAVVAAIAPVVRAIDTRFNEMLQVQPPTPTTPEVDEPGGLDVR